MKIKILILTILSIGITLYSLKIGIFWDNVLFVSKMGNHLFETGIFNWNIPEGFDPGHPPFLATLMALGWTFAGKSLVVSHWIMLPFIFGLLWQIDSFITYFVKDTSLRIWANLLVVADPSLLSQFVLVNPEVVQLFFFFLTLNALLKSNTLIKITGLAFLGIVSYRGMMLCAGIFLIDLLLHLLVDKRTLKQFATRRKIAEYLIGAIPAVAYVGWRLATKGWLQTHPDSLWADCWRLVSFDELMRNLMVLAARFADFGRITILLFLFIALYVKRKSLDPPIHAIIVIAIASTLIITLTSLAATNPMGHRYFIASYLAFALLAFVLLQKFRNKKIVYSAMLGSLMLGNFLVYPDDIAQGWDASLAHLPYWKLRKNAIEYLEKNQIPISETATFFPNFGSIDGVELNGDQRAFACFQGTEDYVLYSNVFNLSDNEFSVLHTHYQRLTTFQTYQIRVEIWRKKNFLERKALSNKD